MVRCPRCGYEFVDESTVVNFFRKIFRSAAKDDRTAVHSGIDQC
jgi:hypothetical protein